MTWKGPEIVKTTGYYWVKAGDCQAVIIFFMIPKHEKWLDQTAKYAGPLVEPVDEEKLSRGTDGM